MHWVGCVAMAVLAMTCSLASAQPESMPRAVIPFDGVLDLKARDLSVTFGKEGAGVLVVEIKHPALDRYDLRADIRHITAPAWDVAAVLNGKFMLAGNDPLRRELSGELSTQYMLLNYKPVRDAYVKFAVRERRLIVDAFWFGALSGKGMIDLMGHRGMDVSLELLSADLDEFWDMLAARGVKTPPVSGIVTVAIDLKGPAERLAVSGRVSAYNGRLKQLDYDSLDLRFEGIYPLIHIAEGRIDSSDGPSFRVSGALDVGDIQRLGTQVRQLKREFVTLDRESGRAWAFRRMSTAGDQTTQLKSFITGNGDGRDSGESVVGLQKHIGF